MSRTILLINGPNLNLLGTRKPEIYGSETLAQVVERTGAKAKEAGAAIVDFQSNSEGAIIDAIHAAQGCRAGIIINPGAYSHTSIAIRDALEAVELPVVEVHISDIHAREEFRRHSYISDIAGAVIVGRGTAGYLEAVDALLALIGGSSS